MLPRSPRPTSRWPTPDLGQIVVDGSGRTVYFFDNDVAGSGQSTCTGQCATMWPAAHPAGAEPVVDGITAEVATIIGTDGRPQLTIDGRPVYTFASDEAPGDVNGQGVNDLWYVVGADGAELKDPTQSEDPSYWRPRTTAHAASATSNEPAATTSTTSSCVTARVGWPLKM